MVQELPLLRNISSLFLFKRLQKQEGGIKKTQGQLMSYLLDLGVLQQKLLQDTHRAPVGAALGFL